MLHYVLLTLYTAVIAWLTWRLWKKTRQIAFVLGIALIYYWSLAGAWFIVYDELTNMHGKEIGLHYYDYLYLLFPVHADSLYYLVCFYYALFIVVIQLTLLWLTKPADQNQTHEAQPVRINHYFLIVLCIGAALISLLMVWKEILTAAKFSESIYIVTRMQPGKWFTLHQLLNQAAVVSLYVGLISYISGTKSRFISGSRSHWILAAYAFAVIIVEGYLLLLGNKREILFGGILGVIFYLNNVNFKINYRAFSLFIVIILIPLLFNDGLRSYSPKFLTKYFDTSDLQFKRTKEFTYSGFTMSNTTMAFLFSNEMFCAHFSMYGILDKELPLTYGSSFNNLAASMIPRAIVSERPKDIYTYYAEGVHAKEGQGYTIHHASGWYLNFGVFGILAGAILFGWIWSWLYNHFMRFGEGKYLFTRLLYIIGIGSVTAAIPTVIRSGPEVYKALIFEALLIPTMILFAAAWLQNRLKDKPEQ
ncbi:MAG: hypothetical protein L6Q81_06825 [Bacteroidia bacterium]|nr:hypothetical protein [Bacteroidia bacterium]